MTEHVPQGPLGVRKLRTAHGGTDALSEVKERAIDGNNDNSILDMKVTSLGMAEFYFK